MKALSAEQFQNCNIIPQTMEKFISFTLSNNPYKKFYGETIYNPGKVKFLDSYNFMSSSLANLVDNLAKIGETEFKVTKRLFQSRYPNIVNEDNFKLLLKKGIFPYEYADSFDKFNETKLPSIKEFYSSLNFQNITL